MDTETAIPNDAHSDGIDGASILVVGATGGFGSRITHLLASHGARLTLTARRAPAGRPGASVLAADLADPGGPRRMVDAAIEAHGRLDGVVNAAGAVAFGAVVDLDDATLDALVAVNFTGPLRLLREAATVMDRGFFLTISGVVAEQPVAGMAAYSAAKSAMSAAAMAAARELRKEGVTVIDVRPPHSETGLATRPIAGQPPRLPNGLDPDAVAARILEAIESGERSVPSSAFAS